MGRVPEAGVVGFEVGWVSLWLDGGQCRPRPSHHHGCHCRLRLQLVTTNHTGLATTLGERGLLVSRFR